MGKKCYEEYPLWMVIFSNSLSISIYLVGAYILYGLGIIFTVLYLIYCIVMEVKLLRDGCTSCYYYGKTCAFGKGRLAPYFFKKGDSSLFSNKEVSWYAILPDFLVFIFPLTGGIIILFNIFNWVILFLMIILLILSLGGNAFIRSLTCKHCKQMELGCPAAELFGGNN